MGGSHQGRRAGVHWLGWRQCRASAYPHRKYLYPNLLQLNATFLLRGEYPTRPLVVFDDAATGVLTTEAARSLGPCRRSPFLTTHDVKLLKATQTHPYALTALRISVREFSHST